jgi:hypothetical protein
VNIDVINVLNPNSFPKQISYSEDSEGPEHFPAVKILSHLSTFFVLTHVVKNLHPSDVETELT